MREREREREREDDFEGFIGIVYSRSFTVWTKPYCSVLNVPSIT